MHKGVILIVEARASEDAISSARDFLEGYQDTVWDWYVVGGRWSCSLAPMSKEFFDKAKAILPQKQGGFSLQRDIDAKQEDFETLWRSLGGEGPNPYSNHYELPENGGPYDCMPLSECIGIVKEWQQIIPDVAQQELEKAKRWLIEGGSDRDNWGMYGYCLKKAGNLFQQDFCFDCNVFNIDGYDYSIPEETNGYYAVVVDMHN